MKWWEIDTREELDEVINDALRSHYEKDVKPCDVYEAMASAVFCHGLERKDIKNETVGN